PAVQRCPLLRRLVGLKRKCCERHQFDAPDAKQTLSPVPSDLAHFDRSLSLRRILKAEGLGFVVVSKGLRKASPSYDCAQCTLRRVGGLVVFEFVEKSASWCDVFCAFLQHTPDVGSKRNVSQQLILENFFTVV